LSIRPDSIHLCPNSHLKGKIKQCQYTGETLDALISVPASDGSYQDILLHTPPELDVDIGDTVGFNVSPEFIGVIKDF
jgi:iron(III) transport system ATP-binding protein